MADIREDGSEVFHYDIPDFPVSIKKNYIPANSKLTDLSIHWHEDIEITYIVSGRVNHYLNGKKVKNVAGEAIFINSKQLHLIEPDSVDCELYCLIFKPTILCASNYISNKYVEPIIKNEQLDYYFLNESDEKQKAVLDLIVKIYELQDSRDYEIEAIRVLFELWQALYNILPKAKNESRTENKDLHRVKQMLAFIQKRYTENIGLEEICLAGDIGKTKCTKLFIEYLNMTPVDYLINYRLEIAAKMLRTTKESVTDIALSVGFTDSSYFARIFKKRIGMTPIKYRRDNDENILLRV